MKYPENLSQESNQNEDKIPQVLYYLAQAYRFGNNTSRYHKTLQEVIQSSESKRRNWEAQYYSGLALAELGETEKAYKVAQSLVDSATNQLKGEGQIDYFAKFGEQSSRQSQRAEAHYHLGLGLLLQNR